MLGSILISGSNKKARYEKAWELLLEYGFKEGVVSADLLIIQKESEKKSIGIAQAREIKEFMRERPYEKKIKAVLVEDAQLLTDDAQGSLLKILEEPPAFGLIILLSDKEGSLLPTVVSRCQKVSALSSKDSTPYITVKTYDLRQLSYEEIFNLAKDLSTQGKEEALDFLEKVMREDLRNGTPIKVIEKTEKAIKELKEANVALKFALEYLLLLHKQMC